MAVRPPRCQCNEVEEVVGSERAIPSLALPLTAPLPSWMRWRKKPPQPQQQQRQQQQRPCRSQTAPRQWQALKIRGQHNMLPLPPLQQQQQQAATAPAPAAAATAAKRFVPPGQTAPGRSTCPRPRPPLGSLPSGWRPRRRWYASWPCSPPAHEGARATPMGGRGGAAAAAAESKLRPLAFNRNARCRAGEWVCPQPASQRPAS